MVEARLQLSDELDSERRLTQKVWTPHKLHQAQDDLQACQHILALAHCVLEWHFTSYAQ